MVNMDRVLTPKPMPEYPPGHQAMIAVCRSVQEHGIAIERAAFRIRQLAHDPDVSFQELDALLGKIVSVANEVQNATRDMQAMAQSLSPEHAMSLGSRIGFIDDWARICVAKIEQFPWIDADNEQGCNWGTGAAAIESLGDSIRGMGHSLEHESWFDVGSL